MNNKYDFDFKGSNIGITVTAPGIGRAFQILKNEVKHPHKLKLDIVIDNNGCDVITEKHKNEFKRLVEENYIKEFER